MKWLFRIVFLIILSFCGYATYDYYRAGYHTLPDLEAGDFPLSFRTGFRGVVRGLEDLRETRVYAGYPVEVPHYLENVWSICEYREPWEGDRFPDLGIGYRYEAVCTIDVDGEEVIRGLTYSRPKL